VHVVVGVDPEGRMYLPDLWRQQAAPTSGIEAFCSLVKQWRPREWAEEKGQIKAGVGPFLERMQRERQAFVYRRDFPVRGDKRYEPSRSAGARRSRGSTSRRRQHGPRRCAGGRRLNRAVKTRRCN
jgi:hypothetical protein